MKINTLELKNFRNYSSQKINFQENLNVLIGKNAQGKTNVLEAIFFAVIGKSFKVNKEKETIKWGQEIANIKGSFSRQFREVDIELVFNKTLKKSIKIDGISIKKTGELLGTVNAVFFSPQELKLVRESPEERRRFMNIDISQTNKRYFYALNRYEKVLANRNKLLKISKDFNVLKDTIDIWDKALVELAEKIYLERKDFIEKLAPFAEKAHAYISGGQEKLEIKYQSLDFKDKNFKEEMLKALEKNLEKDYKQGFTSVGIHRDDIEIFLNGVEVKNFGSQGQQRTAALSMKLAELEIIKERTGEYPILLLDDVFSELDESRQKRLLAFTSRTQTIITCTEYNLDLKANIIKIENGKVAE